MYYNLVGAYQLEGALWHRFKNSLFRFFNLLKGIMAILFAMHTRDEIKDDADMKQDSRRLSDSSFHFYTNDSFHNQTTFKLKI